MTNLAAQALELAQWIRNVTAGKASDQITHVMVSELSEVEATLRDAADELGTRRTPKRKQAKKKRAKVQAPAATDLAQQAQSQVRQATPSLRPPIPRGPSQASSLAGILFAPEHPPPQKP